MMEPQNIVITGATNGIGKATAKEVARRGARLLFVGRDRARCEAVKAEIVADTDNPHVEFVVADLSTIGNVRRAAAEIRQRLDRVDVLVNNAGACFPKQRTETPDGLEIAFVLQYLSRHVLTQELLDRLRAAPHPRVITIAGGGGYVKPLDLDDLQTKHGYKWTRVIGSSSTINHLHTTEQARRLPGIGFFNFGPGLVRTNMTMANVPSRLFFQSIGRLFTRSAGAAGADVAELAMGEYQPGYYGPKLTRNDPHWTEVDSDRAADLWERTESILRGLASGSTRHAA